MARITVEDCLERENNRFALVLLAAMRAKQILTGATPTTDEAKENKAVVAALREVANGSVRFMTADEVQAEEDKEAAAKAAGLVEDPLEAILSAPPAASSSSDESGDDEEGEGETHQRNGSMAI